MAPFAIDAAAVAPAASRRLRLDARADRAASGGRRGDAELFGDALGQRVELHRPQEAEQRVGSGSRTPISSSGTSTGTSSFSGTSSRDIRAWSANSISFSRRFGCLISPARASSVSRSPYSLISSAAGLDADARHARHVVDAVAGQRLHVDHLVRARRRISPTPRSRPMRLFFMVSSMRDAGLDQLHQVLVGGDDRHLGAGLDRLPRIGRDEVVGLEAVLLDRRRR